MLGKFISTNLGPACSAGAPLPPHFSSGIKFPKELEELFKKSKKEAMEDGEPIFQTPELRNKPLGDKGKKYEEKIMKIMAAKRKREQEGQKEEEDKMQEVQAPDSGS